jgi:hypothetical protein
MVCDIQRYFVIWTGLSLLRNKKQHVSDAVLSSEMLCCCCIFDEGQQPRKKNSASNNDNCVSTETSRPGYSSIVYEWDFVFKLV